VSVLGCTAFESDGDGGDDGIFPQKHVEKERVSPK
jgi:hypothetical protein